MPNTVHHNYVDSLEETCVKIERRHISNKNILLSFVFAFQMKNNDYFIFQEIEHFPFNTIFCDAKNSSIIFTGDWKFDKEVKLYNSRDLVEGNMDWKDIPTKNESIMSGVLNAQTNNDGFFNRGRISRPLPRKPRKKDRKPNIQETCWGMMRFEFCNRVDIWDWGFSIRTPTVNMIAYDALKYNGVLNISNILSHGEYNFTSKFPYLLKPNKRYSADTEEEREALRNERDGSLRQTYISIVYNQFEFSVMSESYRSEYDRYHYEKIRTTPFPRRGNNQTQEVVVDLWGVREETTEDIDFDNTMEDLAHGVKERPKVKDVGQIGAREIILD